VAQNFSLSAVYLNNCHFVWNVAKNARY